MAARKDEKTPPRIWVLPETDSLDPYMVAQLELLTPTEGYLAVPDKRAYVAKLWGTQIAQIAVPFDGPVTSLAPRRDGSLWITVAGHLAIRQPNGEWRESPLPCPEAGAKADQVGRLEKGGLWLMTTLPSGIRKLFTSGPVKSVYHCQ